MPDVGGIAGDHLRSFIERIENLESEIKDLNGDKAEVFKEAKGTGFDTKIMKLVIARRRRGAASRDEEDTLVEIYEEAIGDRVPRHRDATDDELPELVTVEELQRQKSVREQARAAGHQDGYNDSRDNALTWASGIDGHGDYELGYEEGRTKRIDELDGMPPAVSASRARARAGA